MFVLVITTIQGLQALHAGGHPDAGGAEVVNRNGRPLHGCAPAFEEQKLGYASAVSVILFLIVLVIALVQRRLMRRFDV